jgi:PIN domain nuclease of toxin-antitoxin system
MGSIQDDRWAERPAYLLLGDQSLDTHAFLAQLFRQEKHGELTKAFLRQAGHALSWEIERLPKLERAKLPVFRTLQQLNERYQSADFKHAGIDAALLTVSQLAHYLE